jgi:hypothetical protein
MLEMFLLIPLQARDKSTVKSGTNGMDAICGTAASGTRLARPRFGRAFDDKIVGSDFERTQCGPKGGEQDARNN